MYNKILITLLTAMLPSAAMCAKSPKKEEEQPQKQDKKKAIAHRLIENKSKPKGDDEKEEAERRNEEEEEEERRYVQEARKAEADEKSRYKKDLFTNFGPNMLRLKKFQKATQDIKQALEELSNEKAVEEMRNKDRSLGKVTLTWDALTTLKEKVRATLKEAVADYSNEVKKLFPKSPARSAVRTFEDVNEALKSPDWNTPEEKKAAEEIDKLKMNPLDMMDGRMFDTYFYILLYYTKMTEEQRQSFRKNAMIKGRTSDNMGIIEID